MTRALGFLIIFMCNFSYGQDTLSIEQVISRVMSYSQDLKLKKIEVKAADLQKREAIGQALPQLSAEISHTQNFQVPNFGGFQMLGDYGMTYTGNISQALYTFGAVGATLNAARSGIEMVNTNVLATENNIEYQAKVAFFQLLLLQRNLEINQDLLKNAQDNFNSLTRNFRGGRPPQGDALRLQADIEAKKPMVDNAKAQLKSAKMALNILMGQDPNKDFKIGGNLNTNFPILSGPILQNTLVKESPTLKSLEKSSEYQDYMADVQWSAQMPKLSLFYQFNRSDQSFSDRFAIDRTLQTQTLGISLRWNIWDGGVSHAAYQKVKVNASKMDFELQKTKDQLSQQVLSSLEQFNTYKKNVGTLEKAVSLARRSFRLSQNRFKSGRTSITELNDTQSALLQAELQEANNLFQLNSTFALLESLVGKDLK